MAEPRQSTVCPRCGSALTLAPEGTPLNDETKTQPPPDPNQEFLTTETRFQVDGISLPQIPSPSVTSIVPEIPNHEQLVLVGRGGMGKVFRGTQTQIQRTVAVKVIHPHAVSEKHNQRFLREMRAQSQIRHPNVLPVYEAGECPHGLYFTMEFVEGKPFSLLLKQLPRDDREWVRIIQEAALGLQAAHEAGIVHRDVKPSNILVADNGSVKVSDFGLAKTDEETDLTQTGDFMGTLWFMSPEQASGDHAAVTFASDIYSLGASLYQALTGKVAHEASNRTELLREFASNPSPELSRLRPDICPILEAIVRKAMELRPADRYASAAEFAQDLGCWLKGEPTIARPLTRVQKLKRSIQRRRGYVAAAILVPLAVVAGLVFNREFDPKVQHRRHLDGGRQVVLVKETGLPQANSYSWDFGDANLTTTITGDGSAGFQTQMYSLLRLLDDPRTDHYRVTLELRHCARGVGSGSYVGMYFGFDDGVTAGGLSYMRLLVIKFSEFWENIELKSQNAADHHRVMVETPFIKRIDNKYPRDLHELISPSNEPTRHVLRFTPTNDVAKQNGWRKLMLDVHPSEVIVTWMPGEAGPGQVARYPIQHIDEMIHNPAFQPKDQFGKRLIFSPWIPRRPLGIFASNATVTFRNVIVAPLPYDSP